jgi:agmatinase
VLHFDAHLDTWDPEFPNVWESTQPHFNHGSVFWLAVKEGLIANSSSVHAGLRTRLTGDSWADFEDDDIQGFMRIVADDIDQIGTQGIIEAILRRIGMVLPVYLSLDVDVFDPSVCPGTGTPEPGGWTSREVITILRGLESLNVVGADIVEVAPAYDGPGEQTALVAAQVAYEILTSWAGRYVSSQRKPYQSDYGRDVL